jgi:signal recognition particle subunit SRP19
MVGRNDEKFVIWPVYFDADASREHRRVPQDLAIEDPDAEAIAEAAADLRLNPVLERDAAHPARWWQGSGRVLVDLRGSKAVLLRQVAQELAGEADAE